jgi:hypothetical protein
MKASKRRWQASTVREGLHDLERRVRPWTFGWEMRLLFLSPRHTAQFRPERLAACQPISVRKNSAAPSDNSAARSPGASSLSVFQANKTIMYHALLPMPRVLRI